MICFGNQHLYHFFFFFWCMIWHSKAFFISPRQPINIVVLSEFYFLQLRFKLCFSNKERHSISYFSHLSNISNGAKQMLMMILLHFIFIICLFARSHIFVHSIKSIKNIPLRINKNQSNLQLTQFHPTHGFTRGR